MNLQIVGLVYDAVGIFILGISAAFTIVDELSAQVGTKWDYNLALLKAFSFARIDTIVGSLILLVGFFIQIASLMGYATIHSGSYLLIGLLFLFFVLYFFSLRTYFSNILIDKVKHKKQLEFRDKS